MVGSPVIFIYSQDGVKVHLHPLATCPMSLGVWCPRAFPSCAFPGPPGWGEWGDHGRGFPFALLCWPGVGQKDMQGVVLLYPWEVFGDASKVLGNDGGAFVREAKYPPVGSRGSLGPGEYPISQGHCYYACYSCRSLYHSEGSSFHEGQTCKNS